ncbi:MAG: serine/threonine-protein kinase [Gammaproteobacteria bacterium]
MSQDSHERWRSLSEHLDQAMELSEPQRAEWLAALVQSDPEMAARVASLLSARRHEGFSEFLAGDASGAAPESAAATLAGRHVGPYVIEAEIGRGGMGSVWRARRADGRYESTVAIKFVHAAWIGRTGEQRFRLEGKLLGQLDHPNIARLIDAGVLDGAQPYLVLEYVEGEPIDAYCDRLMLNVEARVNLFLGVLAAVAHAHSHLIVHRDIKPSNIFVTHEGVVKLLDFGIAKLLDDQADSADLTKSGARALTPQFAAPEQLLGQPVTTATDVYSLGLVLYVLLTGSHPVATESRSGAELIRAVLTEDAPRASTLSTLPDGRRRALQGDLDNIIAKALKKAPSERYPTAEAFAADLRRFLTHEPVSARRDSLTYVLGKLVRRHRLPVGAASITLLALIAGVVGTTLQAREARLQRAEAVAQRDRARTLLARNDAIFDFVDMMLTESVPQNAAAGIQQMLDRGVTFVDVASAGEPDRQAEILRVLASYQIALNNAEKAAPLLEKARQLVEHNGDPSLQAQLACAYADSLKLLGRTEESIKLLDEWGAATNIDGNVAAYCLQTRAILAQNDANAKDALRFAELGLQRARTASNPSAKLQAALLGDKGFALHLQGRNAEADQYYEAALARFRQLGLQDYQDARRMTADWGVVAYGSGDFQRGLALFDHVVRISERISGSGPVDAGLMGNYAFGLEALGRYDEALQAYDRTLQSGEQTGFVGAQAYALIGKAGVLTTLKDYTQAQSDLDRAAGLMKDKVPEAHPAQIRRMMIQARIDAAQGRLDNSGKEIARVVDLLSARGVSHPALANAYRQRAELESQQSAIALAEADARKALQIDRSLQGGKPFSGDTGMAYLTLGRILRQEGKDTDARSALQAAALHLTKTMGADHPDSKLAQSLLVAQ